MHNGCKHVWPDNSILLPRMYKSRSVAEGPDLQLDAGEFSDASLQHMQQFLQFNNQPQLAENALAQAWRYSHAESCQHRQTGAAIAQQCNQSPPLTMDGWLSCTWQCKSSAMLLVANGMLLPHSAAPAVHHQVCKPYRC